MQEKIIFLVIPCFNEEKRLDVEKFAELIKAHKNLNMIFVDDGSTDNTLEILQDFKSDLMGVYVVSLENNIGKANAVRVGFQLAVKIANKESEPVSWIGFTDSDSQISKWAINKLVSELDGHSTDSIFAVRNLITEKNYRYFVGKLVSFYLFNNFRSNLPRDSQCGLKFFRFDLPFLELALSNPFHTRWFFEIEIYLRLRELGHEMSISCFQLTDLGRSENSKIRVRSYLEIIREVKHIKRIQRKLTIL